MSPSEQAFGQGSAARGAPTGPARTDRGTRDASAAQAKGAPGSTGSRAAGSSGAGSSGAGSSGAGSTGAARTTGPGASGRPSVQRRPTQGSSTRRVRLTVAKVDPWSVLKLSFLLSVGLGIAIVVAAFMLWSVIDGMGVFTDVNRLLSDVVGDDSNLDVLEIISLGRVLSLATVVAVVDVVLLTALSTLGAFLYNITSSLVGGLQVTLSDD